MSALVYTSPLAITGMFTACCIMAKHHVSAGRTAVSASRWRGGRVSMCVRTAVGNCIELWCVRLNLSGSHRNPLIQSHDTKHSL